MVEARSDWAKLPPTRPCRPSTGRALVHRPDRDTTQGSHSRARVYVAKGVGPMCRSQSLPDAKHAGSPQRIEGPPTRRLFDRALRERPPKLRPLAVDLQLLQGVPGGLHEFGQVSGIVA